MRTMRVGTFALALAAGLSAAAGPVAAHGAAGYATLCVACHQPDGEGAPGLAPPLAGALAGRVRTDEGRRYIAQVLISGMVGPIMTRDGKFNGNMPSFANQADEELLAVIGHVLQTFNGAAERLAADDFATARARNLPPNEVSKLREQLRKQSGE